MAEVQKTTELVDAQQTSPSAKEVRKQEVEASAYDFEKSLIKVTRQVRQSSYDVLVDNVNAAKKAGVDVSDIEAQMPELLKKVTRQEADSELVDTQKSLRQSSYNVLVDNVNAAKKAGVDVSDIEAQMPELLKKIQR